MFKQLLLASERSERDTIRKRFCRTTYNTRQGGSQKKQK